LNALSVVRRLRTPSTPSAPSAFAWTIFVISFRVQAGKRPREEKMTQPASVAVILLRNVMEDAGRERNVERIGIKRNFIALHEGEAFLAGETLSAQLDTA